MRPVVTSRRLSRDASPGGRAAPCPRPPVPTPYTSVYMSEEHPCAGCGSPIRTSPQWLCARCIRAWEAAIERQSGAALVADRAERQAIERYRARPGPS